MTTGGVSNVWYGAGDGSVHSSVVPPSQGFAGAGAPSARPDYEPEPEPEPELPRRFCPACGTQIVRYASYCHGCGREVERIPQ